MIDADVTYTFILKNDIHALTSDALRDAADTEARDLIQLLHETMSHLGWAVEDYTVDEILDGDSIDHVL